MKKEEVSDKVKKVWNLPIEFNKILGMLARTLAVLTEEYDRSVKLREITREESAKAKEIIFDVIGCVATLVCKEANIENETLQDEVSYFVMRYSLELQIDRKKRRENKNRNG